MKRCAILMALAGLLLFAMPQSALAQAKPGYSYIEVGYNEVDVDNLGSASDDGNGGYAGAGFGFLKHFHLFGRYDSNNTDTFDIDLNTWKLYGGWHGLLGEKADLIGEVGWINTEFKVSGASNLDDGGYLARVGARWRPIKLFEIGGWISYQDQDLGTVDANNAYEVNAILNLWRFGIGQAAEVREDIETYNAFARFNFGG